MSVPLHAVGAVLFAQVVDKASKACSGICMWVRAMYKYYTVALQVEPKKKRLAEAQESLDRTMAGAARALVLQRWVHACGVYVYGGRRVYVRSVL